MAEYRLKYKDEETLNELARLAFNVRFWTIEFRGSNGRGGKLGSDNRERMMSAENDLDKFLRENVELVPVEELNPEIKEEAQ